MSTCDNPSCYCEIPDCGVSTDNGVIPAADENGLAELLDAQRDILTQVNRITLANYDNVQLNTQIKDLKNMLEMVLMKLQFWDYEHEKTLALSGEPSNDINDINDCELIILDNEVAASANEQKISGEEELEAVLDDETICEDDGQSSSNANSSNFVVGEDYDDTEIQDIDLELDPVDMETDEPTEVDTDIDIDTDANTCCQQQDIDDQFADAEETTPICSCNGDGCPNCSISSCCDGRGCEICLSNAIDKGVVNQPNLKSMKDLMSMLFMLSMATDNESCIKPTYEPELD